MPETQNKNKRILGGVITDNSRIGISSACFYPEDATLAIKRCISLGFVNLEIFLNTFSELEKPYLKNIHTLCQQNGVTVKAVHPFTSGFEYMFFFSAYKQRARDSIDYFYKKYFSAAAHLGADYFVFHGDSVNAPFFGIDNYCEVLSMLIDAAKSEGVTLAHENVSTARAGNPAFIEDIRSKLGKGNIKFVFDIKQAQRAGHAPLEVLDAMGNDIVHVHINDWKNGECKLPYEGALDIDGIVSRLEENGYNGKYILEVYRKNFSDALQFIAAADKLKARH